MLPTVPKIFKNAIYQDLLKYSDPNGTYVASEEALRVLIHFVFRDVLPEPEIISSSKIEETIEKFKDSKRHLHKQFIIEYGNRSIKTPGNPDTIHYAAMNLYLEGETVIALIADHYGGIRFFNYKNCFIPKTEDIKIIFLGGMLYQADHNHCLIFSIQHLILSRLDNELKPLLLSHIATQDPALRKIKMSWLDLPLDYNLDIQSASFYFKKYMSILLEKPNGEVLYQQMREFIEENFSVVSEEVEVEEPSEGKDSQSQTKTIKFLKLVNKGICYKTTDLSIAVHRKIEALEQTLSLIMLAQLGDEISPEIFTELKRQFEWQEDVAYLELPEAENISLQEHMEDLLEFILSQEIDISNLRKGILMASSLLVNLYLLEVTYANNMFFYDILSSSLKENFNFYKKLIQFDSQKLAEFFPRPTFDFERACNHYNPEHLFKAFLKNFIRTTQIALGKFSYNVFFDSVKLEYFEELIERTEFILFLFNPLRKMEEYQDTFNELQDLIECCLENSYCFRDDEIQFLGIFLTSVRSLKAQLNSFQDLRLTREALVQSEAFAISFVSSHPFVEYLFNNSPLLYLNKMASQPKNLEDASPVCATPPRSPRKLDMPSEAPEQSSSYQSPRTTPTLETHSPGARKSQAAVKSDNHFIKVKTMFKSSIFQLCAKINLFDLKTIIDAIFNTHTNSIEINIGKLNDLYTHFNHIQLLLTQVLNGITVVLSKAEVENILLHRKGSSLKFLVVNQALINKDLSLEDLETHREVIRNSKFIETDGLYNTKEEFDTEYETLLSKTGRLSPVSVTGFSLFAGSRPGSPIERSMFKIQGI
jgi:hypothetical protein